MTKNDNKKLEGLFESLKKIVGERLVFCCGHLHIRIFSNACQCFDYMVFRCFMEKATKVLVNLKHLGVAYRQTGTNIFKKGGEYMQKKYSAFGLAARVAMLKENLTITALAKELGITTSYLSYIFKGDREGIAYRKQIEERLKMKSRR